MPTFLSFDCAVRTLGHTIVHYNHNWRRDIASILRTISCNDEKNTSLESNRYNINEKLEKINTILNNTLKINFAEVKDVSNQKVGGLTDIDIITRTKDFLQTRKYEEQGINYVLLEFQTENTNRFGGGRSFKSLSKIVYTAIASYYVLLRENLEVKEVSSAGKSKLCFAPNLDHGIYKKKYSTSRSVKRNHSCDNFKYFLQYTNQLHTIKNVKKSELDHVADSFLQIIYFIKKNQHLFS